MRGRDRDLVIDTGLGIASLRDAARDLFERPLAAVATHTHMDHTGGMHEFDERWVHDLEAKVLARGSDRIPLDLRDYDAETLAMFAAIGYEIAGGILTAIPYDGYDPRAHEPVPAPPTRRLSGGDIVDLGNRSFEVLHLPGHSPGSIGLWDARERVLFSGDAIYDGPLLDELPGSDIRRLRRDDEASARLAGRRRARRARAEFRARAADRTVRCVPGQTRVALRSVSARRARLTLGGPFPTLCGPQNTKPGSDHADQRR